MMCIKLIGNTKKINDSLRLIAAIAIFSGCSECVDDPKFFHKDYHWSNPSPYSAPDAFISYENSNEDYEFNPRWFPMATAPNVEMTFDRENSEVRFEYLMGETHVTEIWKITKLTRDQASREDECPPFSE